MADQNVLPVLASEFDELVRAVGAEAVPPGFSICEEAYGRAALSRPWVTAQGGVLFLPRMRVVSSPTHSKHIPNL